MGKLNTVHNNITLQLEGVCAPEKMARVPGTRFMGLSIGQAGVLEDTSLNFIFILRGSRVGGDLVRSNREWCLITVWKWISAVVDGGAATFVAPGWKWGGSQHCHPPVWGIWVWRSQGCGLLSPRRSFCLLGISRKKSKLFPAVGMLLWTNVCFQMTDVSDCHKEKPDSGSA